MKEIITTRSIGPGIADVEEDFILSEEPMSRLVFHAQIHKKGIRGKIIRQRRGSKDDSWNPDKAIDIRTLGKNESINLHLHTDTVANLYHAILKLVGILKERGIEYGEHKYTVVNPSDVVITDQNKAGYIKKILKAGYDEDIWNGLVESNPSLVTKMSYAKLIADKKNVLKEFKNSLELEKDESYWQSFFTKNQWIFGYGLNYQFLHLITDQPRHSGADYSGGGEQRGDYLLHSEADQKFTVLVEIKKPQANLVLSDEYRNGVWKLNNELLWAVSQMQINCDSWFRHGSQKDKARDELECNRIFTFQPKGILVTGHTKQLDTRDKLQTFEAYRRNLHNPDVLTFDELYERARFIVEHGNNTEFVT